MAGGRAALELRPPGLVVGERVAGVRGDHGDGIGVRQAVLAGQDEQRRRRRRSRRRRWRRSAVREGGAPRVVCLHRRAARPRPLLLRGAEHRRRRPRRRVTSPRTRPTTTPASARTRAARTIGEHTHWAVENIDGQWFIEDAIDDGERVVIEWTMTWTRPGVRRAAAGPRHGVVRVPRRQDRRGARLPPRRPEEPAAATCSGSTTPAGATRRCEGVHQGRAGRRAPAADPPVHRGALRAARVDPPLRREGAAPARSEWEDARWFPNEVFDEARRRSASSASSTRRSTAARAATTCTTPCSPRSSSRCGSGGAGRRASARTSGSPRRRCASSAPRTRSSASSPRRSGARGSPRWASPSRAPGSDVAGHPHAREEGRRRLRGQRLEDVHHQRRARRLRGHRR